MIEEEENKTWIWQYHVRVKKKKKKGSLWLASSSGFAVGGQRSWIKQQSNTEQNKHIIQNFKMNTNIFS